MTSIESTDPTLARLSFWVLPERMAEFEVVYENQVVPLLKQHGLVVSSECGRQTVDGVFSRLFEVETPAAVADQKKVLQQNPAWQQALQRLGTDFGSAAPDHLLRYHFGLYRAPAGPGKVAEAGPGRRQGLWHSFSVQDGLPYPIRDILEDRKGFLWLAALNGGISRFDGVHFTTFTIEDGLSGNTVDCILEDREGHLWFNGGGGVSHYDGRQFTVFTTEDGLAYNSVLSLLEDGAGHLWIGTRQGVSRYDGTQWVTFTTEEGLADDAVHCGLEDGAGHLWFGTDGGVSRYDGEGWVTYTAADGLGSDRVLSLREDRQGTLWAGTHMRGASRFDGERFAPVEELASNSITAIEADDQGNLWFATEINGVIRFDGAQWVAFTIADGLANDQVFSIEADREGNLWFGTFTGVSCYDQAYCSHFTTADGLVHNGVISMLEDRAGQLWFGTFEGVSRYDGTGFTTIDSLTGPHGWWSMVEDRQGQLWFGKGSDGGALRYDGTQFTRFTTEDGLANNCVWSLLEDRQGQLWFGTAGGVSRYDGKQFITLTTKDGLAGDEVCCILEDREGYLWFGTAKGVSRYDGMAFKTFTPEEGLPCVTVRDMLEDRQGQLWFGTFGVGVSHYDGRVFQTLSRKDGLVFDVVHRILQDRSGDIWIGTEGGITRYRPSLIPPTIQLKDVIADQRYKPVGEIHLPASQKLVIFEFKGRSFTTPPDQMVYVYRLKGYDDVWRPTRTGRVEYADLPLGEYTFQVKAVDRDLNYSEPASVGVMVELDPRQEALAEAFRASSPAGEFIGGSAALQQVQAQLADVAPIDLTVLILGETGTGKGLAARTLHTLSPRLAGPFITVSCGSLPERLVESELFGHEKGAFTGAHARKLGKVELAQGGTLFLDEIGDLMAEAQGKLLRLLEEGTFERVGGAQEQTAEVRVIAATNRDLAQMMRTGLFREDLYFRLQGFAVTLPPLRQRREDILLLATYFMDQMAAHLNKTVTALSAQARAMLETYAWPGNVRELEHVLQRAVVVCRGNVIQADDLLLHALPSGSSAKRLTPEEYERQYILEALEQSGWVIKGPQGAAQCLGWPEATVRYRMKKLNIQRHPA